VLHDWDQLATIQLITSQLQGKWREPLHLVGGKAIRGQYDSIILRYVVLQLCHIVHQFSYIYIFTCLIDSTKTYSFLYQSHSSYTKLPYFETWIIRYDFTFEWIGNSVQDCTRTVNNPTHFSVICVTYWVKRHILQLWRHSSSIFFSDFELLFFEIRFIRGFSGFIEFRWLFCVVSSCHYPIFLSNVKHFINIL